MNTLAANTVYRSDTNSLECLHCLDATELRQATGSNPELLMQICEEYERDHAKCHKYKGQPAMQQNAVL